MSTTYLQKYALLEERMAMPCDDAELITDKRRLALGQFLKSAIWQIWSRTNSRTCLQKIWLDSMQMCDILAGSGVNFADQATSHAIAVLRIMRKTEDGTCRLPSDALSTLTVVLARQCPDLKSALPQEIDSAELHILRCVSMMDMMLAPSLHSWLAAFFSRLIVLTQQHLTGQEESVFGAVMVQLWKQIYTRGIVVVMHVPSPGLLAPRSLAMGLLGLGFVSAGMLPLHGARPEWLEADEWERVYVRAMGPVPAANADAPAAMITQIIQLATGSSMDAFNDACGRVAFVVVDVALLGATEPVSV